MNRRHLGLLALIALFGTLLLTVAGCAVESASEPTPTIWYMVVTNTPQPTTPPQPTVPTQQPAAPPPTTSPTPTATSTPMPTPPPLPTSVPPTKAPTARPQPTAVPPTAGPTFTPVPTVPLEDVCQGDETMTFDPETPRVGEKLTVQVTSAKAHQNVRLDGPGKVGTPDKIQKGEVNTWTWFVTVPRDGKLTYTFYVENVYPCTSNKVIAEPPEPQPNIQLSCAKPDVKGNPGETVKIVVVMKNTGDGAGTFNVDIDKSAVPGGWQAVFCLGGVCYQTGPVAQSLAAGASAQIEVDVILPEGVSPGKTATVKVIVISQHDSSVKDSLKVSVTSK